jgi:hypothetical protein
MTFKPRSSTSVMLQQFVAPMLARLHEGINCTLISVGGYEAGQEAVWLETSEANPARGVDLLCDELYAGLVKANTSGDDVLVVASMYQIANEQVVDLLVPRTRRSLALTDHRLYGLHVGDAAELDVYSADELKQVISEGLLTRRALQLRSRKPTLAPHTFINVRVERRARDNANTILSSTLRFCLMASTDMSDGSADEIGNVTFSNIMKGAAGGSKAVDIPWLKSRVTALLRSSLIGQTETSILVCANASAASAASTSSTFTLTSRICELKRRVRVVVKPVTVRLVVASALVTFISVLCTLSLRMQISHAQCNFTLYTTQRRHATAAQRIRCNSVKDAEVGARQGGDDDRSGADQVFEKCS